MYSLQPFASPQLLIGVFYMQAPIYVSKQIVLEDAIRIGFGMGRVRDTTPTYDVVLDRYVVCATFGVFCKIRLVYINSKHVCVYPAPWRVQIY